MSATVKITKGRRVLAILLVVMLLASTIPGGLLTATSQAQAADTIRVVIDFEGYNLGQGFYQEPAIVEVPVGATAAEATIQLMGTRLQYGGTGSGFYLEGLKDADTGVVNVPAYITANGGPTTAEAIAYGNQDPVDVLGAFDYSAMSGWMITVNNVMLSVGAGAYELSDGDVVRWQFTLWGYGLDLGLPGWEEGPGGWEEAPGYFTMFDKSELIRALVADDAVEAAKPAALAVIINPLSTEADIAAALAALLPKLVGDPVDITVTFQVDDTGFVLAKKAMTVATDLSERYGYPDTYNGAEATTLDALVAAHIALYGDDEAVIQSKLTVGASGFVTRFLGEDSGNFSFFINGSMPGDGVFTEDPYMGGTSQWGYAVNEAPLDGDDDVLFMKYQSDWYMDVLSWFEVDGEKTTAIGVSVGEDLDVTLKGYVAMFYGLSDPVYQAMNTDPIEEATIVPVTLDGDEGVFGTGLATTDEDGFASLSFAAPGVYILSAIDTSEYGEPLVSPWLVVTVTGIDKTALDAAIAAALAEDEDDYTPESWLLLEAALTTAQAVAADTDATQAEVDQATADLEDALAGLVPALGTYSVTVNLQPATASLVIKDGEGRVVGTGPSNSLPNGAYSYYAGADGYLSTSGSFEVDGGPVIVDVTLASYSATGYNWTGSYRGHSSNMAILTDAAIAAGAPTSLDEAEVSWTASGAKTGGIFVNGALYSASGSTLSRIDTTDGTTTTASLAASIGFNYFITSGEGKIFIQEGLRVEAIEAADMTQAWLSDAVSGGAQGLTPLYYADGFVYGGTTQGAGAVFFCMSAADGSVIWQIPWGKNPSTGGDSWSTYGHYWAGANVIGDYAVFGSESGVLRSVDKLTGETVDVYNIPTAGDIRSSIAYSEGYLYFTVKQGGLVYKVAFDETTGALGGATSAKIDPEATETIATPVVYDGRVYVSASTSTETKAVVGVLDAGDLSHIYSVPLAASVGNASKGYDVLLVVDQADACVYGYTTHYWTPGSITCFRDSRGQTTPQYVDFSPLTQPVAAQYGAAQVIAGPDGTLYFPNDSGKMVALAKNSAYLTALSADTGTLGPVFAPSTTTYTLVVPRGTTRIDLSFSATDGATVQVNGSPSTGSASIVLTEGVATASISVAKGTYSRTYTVDIREAGNDATLADLKLSTSNAWNGSLLATTPAFAADTTYVVQTTEQPSRTFINLWPTPNDENASVVVTAGAGIKNSSSGTTGLPIAITGTNQGHDRYAAYFMTAPQASVGIVTVTVTAEDGVATETYTVVLVKNADTTAPTIDDVTVDGLKVTVTATDDALLAPEAYSFDGGLTWQVSGEKTFAAAGTLAAGTIRVRDAVGNVALHDEVVTLVGSVDKTALDAAIAAALAKDEDDYTPESWALLEAALITAQAVAADTGATQAEVDQATADLENAIAGLVSKPGDPVAIPVAAVTLPQTNSVVVGQSITLDAVVTPADATDKSLTWTSSNSSVATVSANGRVTGVAAGMATITATAQDGSGKSGSCLVTVIPVGPVAIPVAAVTLPQTKSVEVGQSITLDAVVTPADATDKSLTWTSSNNAVATVNANGRVTGVAAGTATITATAQDGSGKSGSCLVTVDPVPFPEFIDVPTSHPYHAAITSLAQLGIISGYPQTSSGTEYRPDNPVLRAQVAKMLVIAFGLHDEEVTGADAPLFFDVPLSLGVPYPFDFVQEGAINGLIKGFLDGSFRPYENVTRVQLLRMLVRGAGDRLAAPPAGYELGFTDVAASDQEIVAIAKYNGIIDGRSATIFDPAGSATRGHFAKMLYNVLSR